MNEEPKQIKCYCGHTIMCDCSPIDEPKQELEEETWELANKLFKEKCEYEPNLSNSQDLLVVSSIQEGIIKGAKWQKERMYSEEDMKKAFIAGGNSNITEDDGYGSRYLKYMDKWFEQYKKK